MLGRVKNRSRSNIRRHADRSVPDSAGAILAQGLVAHVGIVVEGQPYVIPFSYHFEPDPARLYLHGSRESRTLRHLATGAQVCVTVTLLDGLVYSKSAFDHTMNYRSVVAFGMARPVTEAAAKACIFDAMTRRYFPGRTAGRDYQPATGSQLDATELVEIEIQEMSAKVRAGGPTGPLDAFPDAPGDCGVLPVGV